MPNPIILAHRVTPPGVPGHVIVRPRLNELYARMFDRYRHVVVVAPAGAGKSVQAQLFAESAGLPIAWLSLREAEASPSRLLAAMTAALGSFAPTGPEALDSALRSEVTAEEAAAMVAPTVSAPRFLFVVDQCEALSTSEEAATVLSTFAEYAPPSLMLMSLSRTEFLDVAKLGMLEDSLGVVTSDDLRLTAEEAAELVASRGRPSADVPELLKSTHGWAAGLAFALRGDGTRLDAGNLSAYIQTQVLGDLPEDERQFLRDTSILEAVTPDAVDTLLGVDGRALYERVRARHLPATTMTQGSIVYHSVFKTVLRADLVARDPGRETVLLGRYAEHLMDSHHAEEAAELLLQIRALDRAAEVACDAVAGIYKRADWDVLAGWLGALGDERVMTRPVLVAARIRTLYGLRLFDKATVLIRRLDQLGQLRAATEADPGLVATMGWALQADPDEARRLLDRYQGDYLAEAVRFMLDVDTSVSSTVPPPSSDWGPLERVVAWALILQGRLQEVTRLIPTSDQVPIANPNVALAPLWRGDAAAARALWERVPHEVRERPHSLFIEACIFLGEGDVDSALAAARAASAESRRTGFPLNPLYEVLGAYLHLVLDQDEMAVELLEDRLGNLAEVGQLALVEWAQAFLGLGYLRVGRSAPARLLLQECVRSMERAKRRLLLPFARWCLAAAETREGHEDIGHELAQLAVQTTSRYWLAQAATLLPEVGERERAADPQDRRWQELTTPPAAAAVTAVADRPAEPIELYLQPFGREPDLLVGGEPQRVGRLKMLELVGFLCLHPAGVDRTVLQQQLFPDSDQRRGGNHFRQIAHKLRSATGVSLARFGGSTVTWPAEVRVDSGDLRFERLLEAARQPGADRRSKLQEALRIAGSYLDRSDLTWAADRRYQLDVLREEVLLEMADLCLAAGDFEAVRAHGEALLEVDPYNEACYRLLLRAERELGTPTSCLGVYRRAVKALGELGLTPEEETVVLVKDVRERHQV